MKKSYLLAVAAGMFFCLAINAQVKSDGSLLYPKGKNGVSAKSLAPSLRQAATRAAESLPDSLVYTGPEGGKTSKEVYSYTDKGLLEKTETFVWDENDMSWVHYGVSTNTYDEQGRLLVYTNENEDEKSKQTFTYEGNAGSYSAEFFSEMYPLGFFYKGNTTYDAQGNCLSRVEYFQVDVNGDGVIDQNDKDNEGNLVWTKSFEEKNEYDKAGRLVATDYVSYWRDEVEYTLKGTNVWDGDSRNYEQTVIIQYTGEEALTQKTKYEVEEGNPMIGSLYLLGENGTDWILKQKEYYYYPKGGSTANEALETPAQEAEIAVAGGTIYVSTSASVPVQVYNILGVCHYNAVVNGSASVSGLSAGVYVVRAGKQVTKVSVR